MILQTCIFIMQKERMLFMLENLFISLKIMGQGMSGIFIAILLIMLVIYLISKLDGKESDVPK